MTDIPDDIMKSAEEALDKMLCNCRESCGGTQEGLRAASIADIAEAIMAEREHSRQLLSEAEKREREARGRRWRNPHKSLSAMWIGQRLASGIFSLGKTAMIPFVIIALGSQPVALSLLPSAPCNRRSGDEDGISREGHAPHRLRYRKGGGPCRKAHE